LSELVRATRAALAAGGAIAAAEPKHVERAVQLEMATAVAEAIEGREALVVEAGTGVGKTFAYLVPLLLSGARALLSTATRTLQDQLFLRDLPRVRAALGLPVTVALLKGRANYLCLHRLGQARQRDALPDRFAVRALARIEEWAQETRSGDLAELPGLDAGSAVVPLVTSTRDNCLGSTCPEFRRCHVVKARREAMAADLVVVNHHLFFADLALRDGGVAELLPSVEACVFDEAHQLGAAGLPFLGTALGTSQAIDLARDALAVGLPLARGLAPWQELAAELEAAGRSLRLAIGGGTATLRFAERARDAAFGDALAGVGDAARALHAACESVVGVAADFERLSERAARLAELATRFAVEPEAGAVRWIDATAHQARLVESPLDIREALAAVRKASGRAWIFTSATLGEDASLAWFTEPAGLEDARTLRLGSPYDFASHARLHVARRAPKPSEPGHADAVARLAARAARAAGGRTFVLTTTLRSLQTVGTALQAMLGAGDAEHPPMEVLVQGQRSRREMVERFLAVPHAVLVGSQSFWEGVDVVGERLQCVVIDKLPFPPPNDPLVEARSTRLERQGRNPFSEYFVPEAAIALKQGAGRLIRSETDRGLLVVCDPRLATMPYGRRILAALPPMPRLDDEDAAVAWLAGVAGRAG
jgi:ATP-dependent DNA helicase DinG